MVPASYKECSLTRKQSIVDTKSYGHPNTTRNVNNQKGKKHTEKNNEAINTPGYTKKIFSNYYTNNQDFEASTNSKSRYKFSNKTRKELRTCHSSIIYSIARLTSKADPSLQFRWFCGIEMAAILKPTTRSNRIAFDSPLLTTSIHWTKWLKKKSKNWTQHNTFRRLHKGFW